MKYQTKPYSCGPASVVNALRVYGKKVSERNLIKACGTIPSGPDDGTTEVGIKAGIVEYGFTYSDYEAHSQKSAWDWMEHQLIITKAPVICCVNQWSHWVTVIGKAAERIVLIDPSNAMINKKENGIQIMSKKDFLKKWNCKADKAYYGCAVLKK